MVDVVRWGVLGAARIAEKAVIPAIRRAGAGEVVAVSSASGRAQDYAERLGIERHYGSHEELLADPDVDAVYVPLPNTEHARWTIAAVEAGKHVLCEKPIVQGVAELDAVEGAARRAGVQVAEAFMYRYHPQLQRVREMLEAGEIGELVTVESSFHFVQARTEPLDIRLRRDLGGGAHNDIGCYPVDLLGWLTGAEPDDLGVVATVEEPGGAATRVSVAARYGAVTANLHCSFDAAFRAEARLIGSAGAIHLPDVFRADQRGGVARIVVERDGAAPAVVEVEGDQYGTEVARFAERVRTGTTDPDDAALSRRTAATLERITQLAYT
ncbi:Predicted dehydrogenase [Georgenia satyanarayanai]|uniref:Predicted dehydrogenase n=1 Tax=Georgenia satyanarayanai TaxID=860221 RepID=A0A2Y9A4A1_9MICO|nr:Gfo/Idh/MocA family oxidoreductase [Georgenia satyanarayanai]PYG01005.1 putative dehydrogenase [Georgenia satyanarayanai]SSA39244.1 Predicted dehydrogenase [Georgenia satyanarayanai]